jgi:2-isopropylmalate synthase
MRPARVLLFGASGFLGRAVGEALDADERVGTVIRVGSRVPPTGMTTGWVRHDLLSASPDGLADLLRSLLVKDPAARPSEEEVRRELRRVAEGTGRPARAEVTVANGGGERTEESEGDGPVDAVFRAISRLLEAPVELAEYSIGAVTGGTDALGEVRVVVRARGRSFSGQAVSTDITEASAEAYLRACAHAKTAAEPEQELAGV